MEQSINIEKLVASKVKEIFDTANNKDWLDLKALVKFTKFSFDNLAKKNLDFDKDNADYKLLISVLPSIKDLTFDNIYHMLTELSKNFNWRSTQVDLDRVSRNFRAQAEFDFNYPSIESSLISSLMKLDVADFNGNLEVLSEINNQVEDAYELVLHSNMKKADRSYTVLFMIGEMYDRLGYQKKAMNDVVDSPFMDSLVVSLNALSSKFKGLVSNYLKSDVNRTSNLSKRLDFSQKVLKVLEDNLDSIELENYLGLSTSNPTESNILMNIDKTVLI